MRSAVLMFASAVTVAAAGVTVALPAQASVCFDLWVQRNTIYKAYGYCFKTRKAIDYFGNAGCIFDNAAAISLSVPDRRLMESIKRRERQLGCL